MKISLSRIAVLATAGLGFVGSEALAGPRFYAGLQAGALSNQYKPASLDNGTVSNVDLTDKPGLVTDPSASINAGARLGMEFESGKFAGGVYGHFNFNFNEDQKYTGLLNTAAAYVDATNGDLDIKNQFSFGVAGTAGFAMNGGTMYGIAGIDFDRVTLTTSDYGDSTHNGETKATLLGLRLGVGGKVDITSNASLFVEYHYRVPFKKTIELTDKTSLTDLKIYSQAIKVGGVYNFNF